MGAKHLQQQSWPADGEVSYGKGNVSGKSQFYKTADEFTYQYDTNEQGNRYFVEILSCKPCYD